MAESAVRGTLGQRLERERVRRFVGRVAERELFEAALEDDIGTSRVLFVHGPGGVGKSSLLLSFARLARARGIAVAVVDGRSVPATAGAVLDLLEVVTPAGQRKGGSSLAGVQSVVLVDAYEQLESLDAWFREVMLPGLPDQVLVVVAGRRPLSVAWRTDPAWHDVLRVVSLRNLSPDDGRRFLLDGGVPPDRCDELVMLTYGHPLALALAADVVARGGDPGVEALAPDVVSPLLQKIMDDVSTGPQRRAVEVCAVARVTTEALLRDVLQLDDARDVFEWLQGLPFIDSVSAGLIPHDLVRDVLDVDLRRRDRATYNDVFRRVRAHVHRRLHTCRGVEQQRAIFDEKFVFRNLPSVLSPVDWTSWGDAYPEPATPADVDDILRLVADHEGAPSAAIAASWWEEQREAFHVIRHTGVVQGVLVLLAMSEAPSFDPGALAAWTFAARHAPLRPGEVMTQTRFVIDRDRYQAPSPTLNATPVLTMQRYLETSNLSWDFLTLAEPDGFDDYFAIADLPRAAGADFVVGDRRYGLFAHDFRRVPVDDWLHVVTERALAQQIPVGGNVVAEPVVLSHPDFVEAVRQALRDLHRPDLLGRNPLCRARLVRVGEDEYPPVEALAGLVRQAVDDLRHHPRDEKRWRAIDRTYLRPAASQELAAEALDLPFSTYRRHLTEGVQRVVERLWELELYGGPPG